MHLLTIEGLPHIGRSAILSAMIRLRPEWVFENATDDAQVHSSWASDVSRRTFLVFQSLVRKVTAMKKNGGNAVVVLGTPWFEHLPRHAALLDLEENLTKELVHLFGCHVTTHTMVMLHAPHDETFEHMVCSSDPSWNTTSLHDVCHGQEIIAKRVSLAASSHPFPCVVHTIQCPAFFDDNEVVLQSIARRIITMVENNLNRRQSSKDHG